MRREILTNLNTGGPLPKSLCCCASQRTQRRTTTTRETKKKNNNCSLFLSFSLVNNRTTTREWSRVEEWRVPLLIFPSNKTGTLASKILLRFFNLGFYKRGGRDLGREKKRRDSETTTTRARDGSPTRDAASKSSRGWRRARAKASERERELSLIHI